MAGPLESTTGGPGHRLGPSDSVCGHVPIDRGTRRVGSALPPAGEEVADGSRSSSVKVVRSIPVRSRTVVQASSEITSDPSANHRTARVRLRRREQWRSTGPAPRTPGSPG